MMQTGVKSAHLNSTGIAVLGRARLKGATLTCTAVAGVVHLFDATAAATAITYERATTTVTVTHTSHGLVTGDVIGLAFTPASGVSATNGNYSITRVNANSYTIVDPNSGTIAAGTGGFEAYRWLASVDTPAVAGMLYAMVPGEGILAVRGIVATMTNQTGLAIFYG